MHVMYLYNGAWIAMNSVYIIIDKVFIKIIIYLLIIKFNLNKYVCGLCLGAISGLVKISECVAADIKMIM